MEMAGHISSLLLLLLPLSLSPSLTGEKWGHDDDMVPEPPLTSPLLPLPPPSFISDLYDYYYYYHYYYYK